MVRLGVVLRGFRVQPVMVPSSVPLRVLLKGCLYGVSPDESP